MMRKKINECNTKRWCAHKLTDLPPICCKHWRHDLYGVGLLKPKLPHYPLGIVWFNVDVEDQSSSSKPVRLVLGALNGQPTWCTGSHGVHTVRLPNHILRLYVIELHDVMVVRLLNLLVCIRELQSCNYEQLVSARKRKN